MTPLVVRPRPQADALAARLRAAGHSPLVHPLLELRPGDDLTRLPHQLQQAEIVIAVSRHAALFARDFLLQTGQTWPNIDYFAVGEASAEALRESGVPALWPDDPRSEGLLALPGLHRIAGKRVLILRGNGGRELIVDTLRERGADVTCLSVYRRHYPAQDGEALCQEWQHAGLDSLLVTSGELLETLLALVPAHYREWLLRLPLFVPSPRIAEQAAQAGFLDITTARGADHDALLAALELRKMQ
ncbi:uroporphyrinogen-III synthase [Aeromonas schubertii]|uniref:uroporphyrinogen-III synthase n=1 Tax=Aeromonas schubertii TaxID=652 RepID=UPI0010A7ECA5|nr:uroporphyrinogen-III synthase [Aeromonas schubertii]QCG49789.1 uroporphyrinogen-III synthase [Aeromonas schubertii]